MNRNPTGRGLHLLYAVGAILMTIVGVVLAVQQQNAIAAWAAQNPDSMWAKQSNPMVAYIILAIAVVLGLAWPIFCLVWFGLVKRRPEDLTGGEPPAA